MPELPEVETVRRVLEEEISGQTFLSYRLGTPTFYRRPDEALLENFKGLKILGVSRRGKYLILKFHNNRELILHLGMSGRIHFNENSPHARISLYFSKTFVCFQDARRFGRVMERVPLLGPEPLSQDFNADYLFSVFKNKKAAIKSVLMDQSIVAGLGNIYATEALYLAGIRPGRKACRAHLDEIQKVVSLAQELLRQSILSGGTTLPDESYLDPLGRPGRFQKQLKIYGKTICPKGHAISRTKRQIAGRRAYYCRFCQR